MTAYASGSTELRLVHILDLSEFTEKGDDGSVRSCWRRELGVTRRVKLFLRSHLLQAQNRVEAFIANGTKTRLYVAGPPGCGKTTFFLLHFTEYAESKKKKGLLVQFRQIEACEIIVIDGREHKAIFSLNMGNANISASDLLATLKSFVLKDPAEGFDFIVFDGVRQATAECQAILGYINTTFHKMNVHITSLEFDIKGGEGSAGSWGPNEDLHMDSWTYDDYEAAYNNKDFQSKEDWLSILGSAKEIEENGSSGNQFDGAGDSTDDASDKASEAATSTNKSLDEVANAWLKSLMDRKFYYVGGSARLMFDINLEDLLKEGGELKRLETKGGHSVWQDLAKLSINAKSGHVSSLLQRLNGKLFPVSKYFLYRAYQECKNELVLSLKAAAEASQNPAMKGWAFELEQLEIVEQEAESSNSVTNSKATPTLVVPISKSWAEYDGIQIKLESSSSDDVFVIRCTKWNQGCFDLAFYFRKHLLTVNFTISRSHSLKVQYLRFLKRALEGAHKAVDNMTHIAVVPDEETREDFKFDKPEGNGYDQGDLLYNVKIGCSSKLVAHEARNLNALPDGTSSPDHSVQSGTVQPILLIRKLEDVGVFSDQKSARKRVRLQDNDFLYS